MAPTLAQTFSEATGRPAPIHEAGSQDAHEDRHAQEADPTHNTSQYGLGQETGQLCSGGVHFQAWARGTGKRAGRSVDWGSPRNTPRLSLPLGSHQKWRCWLRCWDH